MVKESTAPNSPLPMSSTLKSDGCYSYGFKGRARCRTECAQSYTRRAQAPNPEA